MYHVFHFNSQSTSKKGLNYCYITYSAYDIYAFIIFVTMTTHNLYLNEQTFVFFPLTCWALIKDYSGLGEEIKWTLFVNYTNRSHVIWCHLKKKEHVISLAVHLLFLFCLWHCSVYKCCITLANNRLDAFNLLLYLIYFWATCFVFCFYCIKLLDTHVCDIHVLFESCKSFFVLRLLVSVCFVCNISYCTVLKWCKISSNDFLLHSIKFLCPLPPFRSRAQLSPVSISLSITDCFPTYFLSVSLSVQCT